MEVAMLFVFEEPTIEELNITYLLIVILLFLVAKYE
jgi:hypothetical protein